MGIYKGGLMQGGYVGKMLFVNLTDGTFEERPLPDDMAVQFLGGLGLGARVLYDMMKPGADPLGPDNVLGFVTGPLNATGAVFSGRYMVVCKSPVTGAWNDANSGGYFGPELKKAGFDAVFVSGAAKKPVYIWINDGVVEIRDAAGLWGKDSTETLQALIGETGQQKLRAALIGPSGEKQSLLACVMNETHRAAGRGGAGAVMGSKNLKALAVYGTKKVNIANPEKLREINLTVTKGMKEGPAAGFAKAFGTFGTGVGTGGSALSGDSPVKNWGGVGMVDFGAASAEKLNAPVMDAKYKTKKYACANCPLGCGADYKVEDGDWPVGETYRPEYETMAAFGCLCLNDNAESIIKCNEICNRYGMDTISAGATIAWAIECFENGLISEKETDGLALNWGNAESIVAMTEAMAEEKGFGKILAQGSRKAADMLKKGHEYLQTVNGIELPMHDPRFNPGYTRTYQADPTPARHVKGGLWPALGRAKPEKKYDPTGSGPMDVALTASNEILNGAGLCLFGSFVGVSPADLIEAVTGISLSKEEQQKTGVRMLNMRHAFNLREGQKPAQCALPERSVGSPPQTDGPLKDITLAHQAYLKNFCQAIGWDENTWKPSRQSLEALGGMDDVIRDLYGK